MSNKTPFDDEESVVSDGRAELGNKIVSVPDADYLKEEMNKAEAVDTMPTDNFEIEGSSLTATWPGNNSKVQSIVHKEEVPCEAQVKKEELTQDIEDNTKRDVYQDNETNPSPFNRTSLDSEQMDEPNNVQFVSPGESFNDPENSNITLRNQFDDETVQNTHQESNSQGDEIIQEYIKSDTQVIDQPTETQGDRKISKIVQDKDHSQHIETDFEVPKTETYNELANEENLLEPEYKQNIDKTDADEDVQQDNLHRTDQTNPIVQDDTVEDIDKLIMSIEKAPQTNASQASDGEGKRYNEDDRMDNVPVAGDQLIDDMSCIHPSSYKPSGRNDESKQIKYEKNTDIVNYAMKECYFLDSKYQMNKAEDKPEFEVLQPKTSKTDIEQNQTTSSGRKLNTVSSNRDLNDILDLSINDHISDADHDFVSLNLT